MFRWLHAIIFKWKENKIDNLTYTVQGDKTKNMHVTSDKFK